MKLARLQDSSQRSDIHTAKKQSGLSFSTERQAPARERLLFLPGLRGGASQLWLSHDDGQPLLLAAVLLSWGSMLNQT